MDAWKSKVLPKIKLIFAKSSGKKAAAAAEIVKTFDESKVSRRAFFSSSLSTFLTTCHTHDTPAT